MIPKKEQTTCWAFKNEGQALENVSSLQYVSRLGHVQHTWISEASPLLHQYFICHTLSNDIHRQPAAILSVHFGRKWSSWLKITRKHGCDFASRSCWRSECLDECACASTTLTYRMRGCWEAEACHSDCTSLGQDWARCSWTPPAGPEWWSSWKLSSCWYLVGKLRT